MRIKGTVPEFWWQLDAVYFKDTADLLLEINALGEHGLATRQEWTYAMTLHALDMYAAVPAATQQLRDATGVVSVGLVAPRRECGLHLSRFHADNVVARELQAVGEILSQSAGLETETQMLVERSETSSPAKQVMAFSR